MKKMIFAAAMALCLLAGTSVFAQGMKNRESMTVEQMAQKKTDKMTKELMLNEQQSKQLYDLNLQQMQQMKAEGEKAKMDRKAEMEKVKSILTPEQYEKWMMMRKEQAEARAQKMGKDAMDAKECKGKACDKPESMKK